MILNDVKLLPNQLLAQFIWFFYRILQFEIKWRFKFVEYCVAGGK